MDFPLAKFEYEVLGTSDFSENIHKLINVKIHLHHLHITVKICSYAHDFCNMMLRKNKT